MVCVGGGSNVMGIFYFFVNDRVRFIGVEVGGKGFEMGFYVVLLNVGEFGVFYGMFSYFF